MIALTTTINILSIIIVLLTITYGIREMIKVNTNYKYHFGLGLVLIFISILSLFPQFWIKPTVSTGLCVCIYFFIKIIKQEHIEKEQ